MKYIYTIHYCDQWKSNASMRLQVVTTSVRKFIRELKSMIKSGDIKIKDGGESVYDYVIHGNLPATLICRELNDAIDYAYFEAWED